MITGNTTLGDYSIIIYRDYDGPVYDASGERVGTIKMTIRSPDVPKPSAIKQAANIMSAAAHGAASVAKTAIGIDRATDEQVEARLAVCRACPGKHATFNPDGSLHTCGPMWESMRKAGRKTCGCLLTRKACDLAESCPFGWWPIYRPGDGDVAGWRRQST